MNYIAKSGSDEVRRFYFRFVRFCIVGSTGVVVDMATLNLLVSLDLQISIIGCKIIAAEVAIVNNFLWNDLWTFQDLNPINGVNQDRINRFLRYNGFCVAGVLVAALVLGYLVEKVSFSLLVANALAISLGVVWNFGLNYAFTWRRRA